MTPKFICNDCFMSFAIKINVTRKKTRKGVREQWTFDCPFCGRKYKAFDSRLAAEEGSKARTLATEMIGDLHAE